jgi:hypothetical protein
MYSGFSSEQLKAAQALASGASQGKAAEAAGVTRITVLRWLKKPDFRTKVTELTRQFHQAQTESFVESAKQSVSQGAVSQQELVELFSGIVRDEDNRLSDRLKAGQCLGRWMGLDDGGLNQVQPPELPLEAFSNEELCKRLDILKSQAVVASQFLMQLAAQKAANGETQEAMAVMSRALDLATECVDDLALAANVLSNKGFAVLSRQEYQRLNPPEGAYPLAFDRLLPGTINGVKKDTKKSSEIFRIF